jgi:anti-sigma B factor antagonist
LKEELKAAVGEGASRVVIDLENVEFIDSSGLGALISALKALRSKDGVLSLSGVSEPVANILEITRLDRVFDIAADREDALSRCGTGAESRSEVSR